MKMHHYVECGLDNIYLLNVDYADTDDASSLAIADADRLRHAIASAIVLSPRLLRGPELFFLRTELGFKTNEYRVMLGVSTTRLFKWEEGIMPVGAHADLMARLIYAAGSSDGNLGREVVRMVRNGMAHENATVEDLIFERNGADWLLVKQAKAQQSDSRGARSSPE